MKPTLEELVERYRTGRDERAIEEVVRRTRPRLLAAARRIGAPQDADDCVQTAYLSLVHQRDERIRGVLPWLVTAVVRIAYAHKARQQRQSALAERLSRADGGPSPFLAAADAEMRRDLRERVARLPQRYRDALVLHYLEGLAAPEAALLLGISAAAVRKRLERGRALLRREWGVRLFAPLLWLLLDSATAVGGTLMKKKIAALLLLAGLATLTGGLVWRAVTQRATDGRAAIERAAAPALPAGPAEQSSAVADRPALAGRVLADGRAVAGARVVVVPVTLSRSVGREVAPPAAQTRSDGTGGFRLVPRSDAPAFTIYVEAEGHSPAIARGVAPGDEVTVELVPAATLTGLVMDRRRTPVADARVRWMGLLDGVEFERETRSDAEGRYRFEGLPQRRPFRAAPASTTAAVEVTAAGFAPLFVENGIFPAREEAVRDLVLSRGATIEGVVLDGETRLPLAGAAVRYWSNEGGFRGMTRSPGVRLANPFAPRLLATTRADGEGRFVFEQVVSAGFEKPSFTTSNPGAVAATVPGYVSRPAGFGVLDEGGRTSVEIVCWPAAAARGRVVDGEGRPIEGARLWCYSSDRPLPWHFPLSENPYTISGADGRFELRQIPALTTPSEVRLSASHPDWPHTNVDPRRSIPVRAGETADLGDVVLTEPTRSYLELIVTDPSGKPVWNAEASLGVLGRKRRTDAGGRVLLFERRATGEPVRVYVRAKGFARWHSEPVALPEEGHVRVAARLARGATLAGRVTWRDGSPARGIAVNVVNGQAPVEEAFRHARQAAPEKRGLPPLLWYGIAVTDAEGAFRLEGLPPGLCHVAAVTVVHGEPRQAREARVATNARDLALALDGDAPPERTVAGRVLDARTGEPVPGFLASLYRDGRKIEATYPSPGRLRFARVEEGPWQLYVGAHGYAEYNAEYRPSDGPIVARLERGVVVHGVVRAEAPLAGATIWFHASHENALGPFPIAADGRYEASGLHAGHYLVFVKLADGRELVHRDARGFEVAAGEHAKGFDPDLVVGGRLRWQPAKTPKSVTAILTGRGGKITSFPVGQTLSLPPGDYVVFRDGEPRPVEIVAGETVGLD